MSKQRPISEILGANRGDLRKLVATAEQLQQLNQRVNSCLPAPLRKHCRIANRKENTLVIMVDSSVWATKLRLFIPKLTKITRADNIELIISPTNAKAAPHTGRRATPLSTTASSLVLQLAETTHHPKLKGALQRLADNTKPRGSA